MDNSDSSLIYCSNYSGQYRVGATILAFPLFFAILANSLVNTKLSQHRFLLCLEKALIKTIQTIPHNLCVSFKSTSLYCGLRLILVYPNHQWYRLNCLDEPIFIAEPKPLLTKFGIHHRLVYFLIKVSLHPMAKTFMVTERVFSILQCTLVETLKSVFYYTSCQPNWLLLATLFQSGQDFDYLVIPLKNKLYLNNSSYGLLHATILIEPTMNCSILEKMSIMFNTGCFLFFTMNCFLRFYLIVVKQSSPSKECLTGTPEIVVCTILGFALTLLSFFLSLDDQYVFSRDCLAISVEPPPPRLSKSVYNISLNVINMIDLVLLTVMVVAINRAPTVTSTANGVSSGSKHFQTVVAALIQLVFNFLNIAYILLPYILSFLFTDNDLSEVHSTIMSDAMAISYVTVYVHSCAPALSLWSSTECRRALRYFARKMIPCCGHSKGSEYPVLVLSDRDRALALARQAAQWRKEQLTSVEKSTSKSTFCTLELESNTNVGDKRLRVTTTQPGKNLSEQMENKITKFSLNVQYAPSDVTKCRKKPRHLIDRPLSRLQTVESVKQTISSLKEKRENWECITPKDHDAKTNTISVRAEIHPRSPVDKMICKTVTTEQTTHIEPDEPESYKYMNILRASETTSYLPRKMDDLRRDSNIILADSQKTSVPVTAVPKLKTVKNKFSKYESVKEMDTHSVDKGQPNSQNLRNLLESQVILSCTRLSLMCNIDDPVHKIEAFKIEMD